jgi:hypothetical protein
MTPDEAREMKLHLIAMLREIPLRHVPIGVADPWCRGCGGLRLYPCAAATLAMTVSSLIDHEKGQVPT